MSNLTLSAEQEYEAAKKWLNTVIELLKEQNEGVKFYDVAEVTDVTGFSIHLLKGIAELAKLLAKEIVIKSGLAIFEYGEYRVVQTVPATLEPNMDIEQYTARDAKEWLDNLIEVVQKQKIIRKFNERVIAYRRIVDGDIMLRQGITELAAILGREISCKKTEWGIRLSFWYEGNQIIQWLDEEV